MPQSPKTSPDTERHRELERIPVIEERLDVDKRQVVTGTVKLTKQVSSEEVEVETSSQSRGYQVERRQVGSFHDEPPASVYDRDGARVYRVIREVPVVHTRYEVVEEIILTPENQTKSEKQQVSLRREEITVDRQPARD